MKDIDQLLVKGSLSIATFLVLASLVYFKSKDPLSLSVGFIALALYGATLTSPHRR